MVFMVMFSAGVAGQRHRQHACGAGQTPADRPARGQPKVWACGAVAYWKRTMVATVARLRSV